MHLKDVKLLYQLLNIIIDMDSNIISQSILIFFIIIPILKLHIFFLNFHFRTEVNIRSPTSTLIVWLQNNSGYQKWSPSEDKIEALLEAFRPGRERVRDRQVLLSPKLSNI